MSLDTSTSDDSEPPHGISDFEVHKHHHTAIDLA